jgi:N-acetylglucosamine-6-sulfatase
VEGGSGWGEPETGAAAARFDRRRLLKYAVGGAAAATLARLGNGCVQSSDDPPVGPSGRRNVLIVLADDMRFDFLPYMPNVQRLLVEPGLTFTQARCNVGLCQPSRVTLLTGQWSIHNGVLGQDLGSLSVIDQNDTLGKWMKDAGYRTALIGKYLNGQGALTPRPAGWDVWRQLVDDASTTYEEYGFRVHDGVTTTSPDGAATDYLETESLSFINEESSPWFLLLTPTSPHFPFSAPEDTLPPSSDVDWPIVLETDASDKPSWISSAPGLTVADIPVLQETARAQLAELTTLDRAIGNIIDGMSAEVLASTVIIFSSDNGLNYGEHRNTAVGISKNELYDVSLRVPCVIRGPGFSPGVSSVPVSIGADLTATACAIGNARPSVATDGVDLGGTLNPDRLVLASRGGGGSLSLNPNDGDCLITPTQKLMRWDAAGADRYEAYAYLTDPDELVNWANDTRRLSERDALERLLDELLEA